MAVANLTKKPKTKRKSKKQKVDETPSWDGHEDWTDAEFAKASRSALYYYNLNFSGKELKHHVINWMGANEYPTKTIKAFKATHDWRVTSTLGATCANLLKGMPAIRQGYNQDRDVIIWVADRIAEIIEQGSNDKQPKAADAKAKNTVKISVQDRLRHKAIDMSADFDFELDKLISNPRAYDIKSFDPRAMLQTKEAKAAHARIILAVYENDLAEVAEAIKGKDKDLVEGYSHLNKTSLKKLHTFFNAICSACEMIQAEGKVNRTTRKKKPKSKEKLVAKLNYKKVDEDLKLVSIKPDDIIGANELWVFNTKTRKIGKYVASEQDPKKLGRNGTGLSIKGTTIIGFDETASIQKTLRKPKEQLPVWKSSGKVKLRKFLDEIKAVDIKLNGRINKDIVLLKAVK